MARASFRSRYWSATADRRRGGDDLFVNAVSLIQAITPKPMLGRVNASLRFLGLGSILIGQLIAGIAGGVLGLRATIAIGAAGMLLAAVILAISVIGSVAEII